MKSRWIINFLLVIAIVVLTLVARFQPGTEEPEQPQAVTSLQIDDIESIRVQRPLRQDLVLKKFSNGDWTLVHTPNRPADRFQVNALSKLAGQTARRSYAAEQLDLAKLQLDPPYATVTLNDTDIHIGTLEALQDLRYIRVNDKVHLIADMYQHLIEADSSQFVRRRLLDDRRKINTITLPNLSISGTDDSWSVTPEQTLSADDIQRFIERWQEATALYIQNSDGTETGENLVLTLDNGQTISFLISAREPELVLIRQDLGLQYRMGKLSESLLSVTPATN